jgi:hypothetical protein
VSKNTNIFVTILASPEQDMGEIILIRVTAEFLNTNFPSIKGKAFTLAQI